MDLIEFKEQTVVIAKDQPEYRPLPAHLLKKLGASESELSDLLCDEFRTIAILAAKMLERDETPARTELAADLRAATGKMLTKIKYMHSAYVKLTNCDQYGEGGEIKGHFCPNELLKEFDLIFNT